MSNALFVHINNLDHMIGWNNAKEIMFCNDMIKRNIIESSVIKLFNNNLLNISNGLYKLDDWLIKHICKQLVVE